MNELSNIQTMSSRDIAELTGKMHKDVLEAVRNMEAAWEKITGRKFPLSEYKDSTGRKLPMYQLSKTECLYVATKFNDEARAKLVLRWEELETKPQLDFSNPETVLMLAQNWKEEQEKRILIEKQLEEQKPKVLFASAVETSSQSCLVAELATILRQNGVEMGQNRLFKWLRANGYLCSHGERYNQPTQRAMEMGLFDIKKTSISKPDGTVLVTVTSKVTGKGQIYFTNKFLSKETA